MGQDKASLLTPDGRTILERLITRLGPLVDLTIVCGPFPSGIRDVHSNASVLHVPDRTPGAGPLAGLETGMRVAGNRDVWVVACDQPDVVPAVGEMLFGQLGNYEAAVPVIADKAQPLCSVYAAGLADRASALLSSGKRSVMDFLAGLRVLYLSEAKLRESDSDLRSFVNLNTPSDYQAWLEKEVVSSKRRLPA